MSSILSSSVRDDDEDRSVSPLELFFDLVYVFAISQLSHHLVEHLDWRTAIETLTLALAVIYAWYMTAWLSNWLSPKRRAVQFLLLALMLTSLLMSSAISGAYEDRAWLFVGGYLFIQIGRALFGVFAFKHHGHFRLHFTNVLAWEIFAGVFWIAGAFSNGDARIALWALAAVLIYVGVASGHWLPGRSSGLLSLSDDKDDSEPDSKVSGDHLFERLRLFFLIALGETLITTGSSFALEEIDTLTVVAFVSAFAGAVALWWCYFQRAEDIALEASDSADDSGGVAAIGTWGLTLMVLALIGIAVADELAIATPDADTYTAFLLLSFGGPSLFLLAQVLFIAIVTKHLSKSRVVGLVALLALAVATSFATLVVASIASSFVLIGVAVSDSIQVKREPSAKQQSEVA